MNDPNARELSAEMRARVGIPKPANGPFRWEFALFLVAVVSLPLALAGLYKLVLRRIVLVGLRCDGARIERSCLKSTPSKRAKTRWVMSLRL
ncbi:MAG: hypothetical protein U0165_05130 [Polyangiaceae bacterium]